jgi:AcrR family transcriptional regulator
MRSGRSYYELVSDQSATPLRADAERNRERILATARQVFAERGLSASLEDIARRAGVGVGTLYRRFPSREDLIGAVFAEKMALYADAVDAALADSDPWRGFRGFIETVCALQAADIGFADLLTLTVPGTRRLQAERDRAHAGFVELIHRAKSAGRLRPDFVAEDLVMLLMANAGVLSATSDAAPETSRRFVAYMLDAFASSDRSSHLPKPPSPRRMYRAMLRWT